MKKIFTILGFFTCFGAFAQDPQFSQFYANPLYLNPAFAGAAQTSRATINYRNQWPALSANYITSAASFDTYLDKYNSGLGITLLNDTQFSNLRSTDIGLHYAYQMRLNEDNFLRMGLQTSYVNRGSDFYKLTFGDQLSDRGATGAPTLDPVRDNGVRVNYFDASVGALFYNQNTWVGFSASHINRPDQSVVRGSAAYLPMKFTLHAGYKFILGEGTVGHGLGSEMNREASISPTILYKKQGEFDQLDAGVYFTYSPLVLGVWYRGIPVKQYKAGINNHDALVFLVGYRADNLSFGYSYDTTISTLGVGTGGSHEISISYLFEPLLIGKKKKPYNKKELACPKF